jgi:hypothetical protein
VSAQLQLNNNNNNNNNTIYDAEVSLFFDIIAKHVDAFYNTGTAHKNEQLEIAIRERLQMERPNFYGDGMLKGQIDRFAAGTFFEKYSLWSYEGVSKIFRTDAVEIINLTTKHV